MSTTRKHYTTEQIIHGTGTHCDPRSIYRIAFFVLSTMTGCASQHARLFDQYIDDIRNRDIHAVAGHMAPEMEAVFSTSYSATKEQLLTIFLFDFAVNARIKYSILEETEDALTIELIENNDLINAFDIHDVIIRILYEYRDGKIIRQTMQQFIYPGETFEEASAPFLEWARVHHEVQYRDIYSEAGPVFTVDSAKTWLRLAWQWNDASRPSE